MTNRKNIPPVRMLPEEVANKIAAGEVVERPASVVKELVENALDAGAIRIRVRLVAAGRRTIEVIDDGHGMSEQDALLAIERHTTSKVRKAEDLENLTTLGFRGEALASIASVSRFELVTRRAKDEAGTRLRIEGGVLRDVTQVAAPVGTRVTVNRLYFNTPVRTKFLKGITTELGHCIDCVQRHALAAEGAGFQLSHNEKVLIDVPEIAGLRERAALIWGLGFVKDLVELESDRDGIRFRGLIGTPSLTRSGRSHQFFFINRRPIVNRSLQYGLEEGYRQLLTVGRHPVGIVLLEMPPRAVDVNIHPAKREARFRDERAARALMSAVVRDRLAELEPAPPAHPGPPGTWVERPEPHSPAQEPARLAGVPHLVNGAAAELSSEAPRDHLAEPAGIQTDFVSAEVPADEEEIEPAAVYSSYAGGESAPMQLFDTYLLVPEEDRLLIIDQHALHERLRFDSLCAELEDRNYEAQRLAVPLLVDVAPAYVKTLESNFRLFEKLGIEFEPFGGNTFQITSICHLYDESKVPDAVYRVLEELAQGELFRREDFMADLLRLATEACRGAIKAGDRLTSEERRGLLDGFRRLRPPYTCPHGRPIITELTLSQMEKSFRRRQ